MAQVNITESFWSDPRIEFLISKLGSRRLAYGTMLVAIHLAQRYWAPKNGEPCQLIPLKIWKMSDLDVLIDCDLATLNDGGVYLKGSEIHFKWLLDARNKGRLGGLKRAANILSRESQVTVIAQNEPSPAIAQLKGSSSCFNPITTTTTITNLNTRESKSPVVPTSQAELALTPPVCIEKKRSSKDDAEKILIDEIVRLWNDESGGLAKIRGLPKKRLAALRQRVKENPEIDYWREVVHRVAMSDFLKGDNERGWRATFDWFIKPDTQVKIIEGHYDNKAAVAKKPTEFRRNYTIHKEGDKIL